MGELDEISYKIGKLTQAVEDVKEQTREILSIIGPMKTLCAARGETLQGYGRRIEALEEKDVLGGTTLKEKAALWGQVAAWIATFLARVFGVKI